MGNTLGTIDSFTPIQAIGTEAKPEPAALAYLAQLTRVIDASMIKSICCMARLTWIGQALSDEHLRTCVRRQFGRTVAQRIAWMIAGASEQA